LRKFGENADSMMTVVASAERKFEENEPLLPPGDDVARKPHSTKKAVAVEQTATAQLAFVLLRGEINRGFRITGVRHASFLMADLIHRAVDDRLQLVGRAADGVVDTGGMMRDGEGFQSAEPRFHRASELVVPVVLRCAVLIAEVDIDSRDLVLDVVNRALGDGFDKSGQPLTPIEVIVGAKENCHLKLLRSAWTKLF
jgi:hypothetical protein